jgi:hypothetical protein
MSTSTISSTILQIILQPSGGIKGLVDELLAACRNDRVELQWHDGRCEIRSLDASWSDEVEAPVRNSVFRAVLARVAALCNERNPGSVSPYGGEAEFPFGEPPESVRVAFVNTAAKQSLSVTLPKLG